MAEVLSKILLLIVSICFGVEPCEQIFIFYFNDLGLTTAGVPILD